MAIDRKLKYREFLSQFPDCPPENYVETEQRAYRWVHKEANDNDFKPVSLIRDPPRRIQDETDLMCKSYGLSLFDNLEEAIARYRTIFSKRRNHLRALFIAEVGDCVAELRLVYEDGIISPISDSGHLTFHEYEETDLRRKIVNSRDIFDKHGNFNL